MILGFDPGRDKCGLAVMGLDRSVQYHQVVPSTGAVPEIQKLRERFPVSLLVLGDQTTGRDWRQRLEAAFPDLRMITVDERYSSLEARERYWQMYPPRGLYRFLPKGVRVAPRPVDDIVALILIERYLERLTSNGAQG
ncbi:Holliday junction resolvase RuvX [Leptolyngbya sp. FACHB-261]|uniref:Holliday junction resolvase RuvX n=1 Tax=Leptolyngbya sp. FACHB-261 TaxID=2692806 RepID=UPI0016895316|nr:Holliday junction resolvase RuvX [Leptolyngbya sp. FACHB-261]MBD2104651.1 Holliday junction resolvase RuvX [Leptolyngbya sp. FACHB-261]